MPESIVAKLDESLIFEKKLYGESSSFAEAARVEKLWFLQSSCLPRMTFFAFSIRILSLSLSLSLIASSQLFSPWLLVLEVFTYEVNLVSSRKVVMDDG